jgi:hypothetical protein
MMTRTSQETSRVLVRTFFGIGLAVGLAVAVLADDVVLGVIAGATFIAVASSGQICGPGDDRRQPVRCLRGRRRGSLITGARDVATAGVPRTAHTARTWWTKNVAETARLSLGNGERHPSNTAVASDRQVSLLGL